MFKSVNGGILPKRFTKYSCGFDVCANEDVVIGAGETKLVGLGIAINKDEFANMAHDVYINNHQGKIKRIMAIKDPISRDIADAQDIDEMCIFIDNFMQTLYLELHIRSSLRVKGLTSLGTGIIDIDFADEIKMVVHNPISDCGNEIGDCLYGAGFTPAYRIKKGDKIGQLILKRHEGYLLPQEYTLDAERNGGFGSTGV